MYIKGQAATISFMYSGVDGGPVSGASLQAVVRKDHGSWVAATGVPIERSPVSAPGIYDLALSDVEMTCDHLSWFAKTTGGVFVASDQLSLQSSDDDLFNLLFGTPDTAAKLATRSQFLDALADHVLRRAASASELSTEGNTPSTASLVGIINLMTQGQMVVTQCNGDKYVFINSSVQGNPPLGALRVVSNSQGVPIGVLPLVGPNAVPDPTRNCDCPE